jgi:pimeloyl-ACP methyl ester carboxylesterase
MSESAKKKGRLKEWVSGTADMVPSNIMDLMVDSLNHDWSDFIPKIQLPTLIIGGRASMTPWQSQVWLANQIENASLVLVEEEDGGMHAMFLDDTGAQLTFEAIDRFLKNLS